MMRKQLFFFFCLSLSALFVFGISGNRTIGTAFAVEEDSDTTWKGLLQVLQFGPKIDNKGMLLTRWEIDVVWAEKGRIDVKNNEGEKVGQFILLEDRGTTWTAVRAGMLERRDQCSYARTDYEAEGRGNSSIQFAWVYMSVDQKKDPLVDVLPHGSYFARGDFTQSIVGTAHYYSEDCEGGSFQETRKDRGMGLSFMLGRHLVHPWASGQSHISAETFKKHVEDAQSKTQLEIRILDTEKRVAPDNLMSGSYTSVGAGGDGDLFWQVSWAISRGNNVQYTDR